MASYYKHVLRYLLLKLHSLVIFLNGLVKACNILKRFARQGASFVYGGITVTQVNGGAGDYIKGGFVFAFNITATIILVCAIVAVLYYFGIMQRIVSILAKAMNFIMRVSGAEALSNVASAFVGQVEAQVIIRPYLKGMTKSELLASMSGSLACIAGGILVVYANMGAKAGIEPCTKTYYRKLNGCTWCIGYF